MTFLPRNDVRIEYYRILDDSAYCDSLGFKTKIELAQHLAKIDGKPVSLNLLRQWDHTKLAFQEDASISLDDQRVINEKAEFEKILKRLAMTNPTAAKMYQDWKGFTSNKENEFSDADIPRYASQFTALVKEGYRTDGGICPVCGRPDTLPEPVCQN